MRSNPPGVEFFYAAKLIGLQAHGISDYVLDRFCPPSSRLNKARSDTGQLRELAWITFCFRAEITEGVMRAVGFRRQEITFDVALRYRFA